MRTRVPTIVQAPAKRVHRLKSNDGLVDATLSLDTGKVMKARITVRWPPEAATFGRRTVKPKPFIATIHPSLPVRVAQIQNVANLLDVSLLQLNEALLQNAMVPTGEQVRSALLY